MASKKEACRHFKWIDSFACRALCQLILDDRRLRDRNAEDSDGPSSYGPVRQRSRRKAVIGRQPDGCIRRLQRRPPLPATLYAEHVAPFLRFEDPLPNMLYVFGGRVPFAGFQTLRLSSNVIHNSVEMLDTWHGCWVQCPPMPCHRAGGAAACLPDGRLLVSGGYDERGVVDGLLSACDAYDPVKECWEAGVAHLVRARWGHSCAVLGNKIYAVGGCSVWQPREQPRDAFMETLRSCEVFVTEAGRAEGRWQPCGALQVARSGARAVALGKKYLVALGGCEDPFGRVQMQTSVELYDADTGCWSLLGTQLASPRTCAVVAALDHRRIVAAGGSGAGDQLQAAKGNSAEVFSVQLPEDQHIDIEDEKASFKHGIPDLLTGRVGCQAAVLNLPSTSTQYPVSSNRCLVAIGGERCDRQGDVQIFARALNLDKGIWCSPDVLPSSSATPRTAVALCVGSGRVVGARLRDT